MINGLNYNVKWMKTLFYYKVMRSIYYFSIFIMGECV